MVSIERVEHGIARFLDVELIPSLPKEGVSRVVTGAAMAVIVKRVGGLIRGYADNDVIRGLGVIDAAGNVDVDLLREAIKANMSESGLRLTIPMGGTITIHKSDVDTLYHYITE